MIIGTLAPAWQRELFLNAFETMEQRSDNTTYGNLFLSVFVANYISPGFSSGRECGGTNYYIIAGFKIFSTVNHS